MLIRKYETIEDCTRLWIDESFDNLPSWFFTERPDFFDRFEFMEMSYDDSPNGEFVYTDIPMWSTWFHPNNWLDQKWVKDNVDKIARLGFVIIYMDGEVFALGIDGAGFDFYEAYWIPLYKLRGFMWHE